MRKHSLNELLGSAGSKAEAKELSLRDLEELLGEQMPKMEYNPVGRLRLMTALRNRFGDNFKNLKGLSGIMKEFDEEAKFNVKLQEMKMIKAGAKNG